ncbi:tetratricopeptide repeat protein [Aquimarina sp. 2201CG14-23]|uniref:tetratricopeptide repeat protein n=1 Tax=Aquimarina mycalae TaxID=3040073 RepID=UPI002477D8FF|nr:tetratricopeptide repeat protein [Aquimarina sp. 2201CG14-23]MDH7447444.1 tetratricopeptide repeat protein [Aquimarina sp. 2201CG14-23]
MKKFTVSILLFVISLSVFSQSEPSFKKNDSLEVLIKIADSLRFENDLYQSLDYAFDAVNYAHKLENYHYLSQAYLLMGSIQYEIIDYENAKKHLLKSLEYSEKTKDKKLMPLILNSLGSLYYYDNNDYKNALFYYKKAVELQKYNSPSNNYQILLHNLIWTYLDLDQYDNAIPYLKEADSIDNLINITHVDRSSLYLQKHVTIHVMVKLNLQKNILTNL